MSGARYAVYALPPRDHPLTACAAAWLGRDAWSGRSLAAPPHPDLADLPDLPAATAFPRRYGFHGTLKAPFALAPSADEADLLAAVRLFVAERPTLAPARLAVATLGQFLALVPADDSPAIADLAGAAVTAFERFRAPLDPDDVARRLAGGLTPRQHDHLTRWGYPYVFEDFRFHLTMTGPLDDAGLRATYRRAFERYAASVLAQPVDLSWIAVFRQADRDSPFTVVEAWPLGGPAHPSQSVGRSGS